MQLEGCAKVIDGWLPEASPPAVVLTYATTLPPEWLLGLTAALYSVPLVLVGLGQSWSGLHDKYHGTLHASRLLSQSPSTRDAAVLFADAWDTMLANNPATSPTLRALRKAELPHTLLSSECNSWPRCYASDFARDRMLSRCLADERRTCYINSGMYAASSSRELASLLPHVIRGLNVSSMRRIEQMHDQAAMIQLFLAREANGLGRRLRLDTGSDIFLSLFPCSGPGAVRNLGSKGAQYCHAHPHEPFSRLVLNGTSARYDAGGDTAERFPLFVHANGNAANAQRLQHSAFGPLHSLLRPPAPDLLRHPVLLLDSRAGGACRVATLGELSADARSSGACRRDPVCATKIAKGPAGKAPGIRAPGVKPPGAKPPGAKPPGAKAPGKPGSRRLGSSPPGPAPPSIDKSPAEAKVQGPSVEHAVSS